MILFLKIEVQDHPAATYTERGSTTRARCGNRSKSGTVTLPDSHLRRSGLENRCTGNRTVGSNPTLSVLPLEGYDLGHVPLSCVITSQICPICAATRARI